MTALDKTRNASRRLRRLTAATLAYSLAMAPLAAVAQNAGTAAPPKVVVAEAQEADIVDDISFVGRAEAIDKVDIVARVSGFVQDILVENGATVEKDQPLFTIEKEQYEASVQARQADLDRAEAELQLATLEFERKDQLLARQTASEAERDVALANQQVAQAAVSSAEAALKQAELDLSYTTIKAPFAGRIGRIAVSRGEVVSPSQKTLVSLVRVAPIYVNFSLNEKQLANVMEQLGKDDASLTDLNTIPEVYLRLPNGQDLDEKGKIAFSDNSINPQTASLTIRAEFENKAGLIVDGAYLGVRIAAQEATKRLLVPQAAVQRDQRGQFVLVVNTQNQVEQRYIQIGESHDNAFIVNDGLKPGEKVITEGLQRVRAGAPVEPVLAGTGG